MYYFFLESSIFITSSDGVIKAIFQTGESKQIA